MAFAAPWEIDGVYDVDEDYRSSEEQIAAMVHSPAHEDWMKAGRAQFVGLPLHR